MNEINQNRICQLLGIRYPIIQAPMNWVSGSALVAAVSEAGGLGTLGPNAGADKINPDPEATGELLRLQIQKVRSSTSKPFAVNVVVGHGPKLVYSKKIVNVLIEEKVPAAVVSVGRPDVYTAILKNAGIKVLHAISTVRHAQNAQASGVDAVICEGFEAGGHKGFTELTTFVLTPMIVDAIDIPVVTGGGIGDARGIVAALALGADAVYMGTRFMATLESESHNNIKQAIAHAKDVCTVSVAKEFMLARVLKNSFTERYQELKNSGASSQELIQYIEEHNQFQAQHLGQVQNAEIGCGQVAGIIREIPSAIELIESILIDIENNFLSLQEKIHIFSK